MTLSNKDPADVRRYTVDWTGVIPAGQTISAVTVIRTGITTPAPVPGGGPAEGYTASETWVWVAGGTAGERGRMEFTVTTNAGEILQRTVAVNVRER